MQNKVNISHNIVLHPRRKFNTVLMVSLIFTIVLETMSINQTEEWVYYNQLAVYAQMGYELVLKEEEDDKK